MARKKKEVVIETNENKELETITPNKVDETNLITQEVTKTNENEEQKVTNDVPEFPKVMKVIAKGGLRVREKASLQSKQITIINYDEEVKVLGIEDEWAIVENGFMLLKFLQ